MPKKPPWEADIYRKFNYYAQFDYFDTARSNIFCYEDFALNARQRKAY